MKKLLYTTAFILGAFISSGIAQNLTQATIERTGPFEITVYAKPTQDVVAGTNVAILFAISVPVPGPEVPQMVGESLIGGTFTFAEPEIINGRKVIAVGMEQPTLPSTFVGGGDNAIAVITFPNTEAGEIVQMNDFTGSGTLNGYWYISYNGFDGTNYVEKFYGATANNGGEFGDSYVEITTPLPVTLLSFNAEKYRDRHALLSWVTTNETNSDYFAIQRSFDNRNWMTVGHVKAAGNSTDIRTYEFIDENVYNGRDKRLTAAYRLMMVDLDDQSNLSPIRSVVFIGDGNSGRDLFVYPNPATEGVQVEWSFDNDAQPVRIDLLDASGRLVLTQKLLENSGQEYIRFDGNINTGHYILRLMGEKEILGTTQVIVGNK